MYIAYQSSAFRLLISSCFTSVPNRKYLYNTSVYIWDVTAVTMPNIAHSVPMSIDTYCSCDSIDSATKLRKILIEPRSWPLPKSVYKTSNCSHFTISANISTQSSWNVDEVKNDVDTDGNKVLVTLGRESRLMVRVFDLKIDRAIWSCFHTFPSCTLSLCCWRILSSSCINCCKSNCCRNSSFCCCFRALNFTIL